MDNNNNQQDLEDLILGELKQNTSISDSGIWASNKEIPHDDALVGAIKRLESREQIVTSLLEKKAIALTSEGQAILKEGSAEFRVWNEVSQPLSKGELEVSQRDRLIFECSTSPDLEKLEKLVFLKQ